MIYCVEVCFFVEEVCFSDLRISIVSISLRLPGRSLCFRTLIFFLRDLATAAAFLCFSWKRSILPCVSINFISPVKKGWQAAQISTWISGFVDPVVKVFPQAQVTFVFG